MPRGIRRSSLGTHHRNLCRFYLGIAQIAVRPPCTQTGTLGHFFLALFEELYGSKLAFCCLLQNDEASNETFESERGKTGASTWEGSKTDENGMEGKN